MSEHYTHELVTFKLIKTPCCNHLLCWVNPRLPNYCPECGTCILAKIRIDPSCIRHRDDRAELKVRDLSQGLLGGLSARPEHQEDAE